MDDNHVIQKRLPRVLAVYDSPHQKHPRDWHQVVTSCEGGGEQHGLRIHNQPLRGVIDYQCLAVVNHDFEQAMNDLAERCMWNTYLWQWLGSLCNNALKGRAEAFSTYLTKWPTSLEVTAGCTNRPCFWLQQIRINQKFPWAHVYQSPTTIITWFLWFSCKALDTARYLIFGLRRPAVPFGA